ncbi:MAG: hypothetical protein ABIC68_05985 [Candidatus Omnitrophota bacterium]
MKKLYLWFIISIFLLGCEQDKYQMIKGEDGKIYRLDKRTGEMVVVKNNEISSLETVESKKFKKLLEGTLETPVDWPVMQMSGKDLHMRLRTSWREGRLYYQFMVAPYASLERICDKNEKDPYYGLNFGFTISLLDNNGFVIKEIPIRLLTMHRIVDDNGNAMSLSENSSLELHKGEYEAMAGYSPTWLLDVNLVQDSQPIGNHDIGKNIPTRYSWSKYDPKNGNTKYYDQNGVLLSQVENFSKKTK